MNSLQRNEKYSITFSGKDKRDDWEHYRWNVTINGYAFEYRTGLGLAHDWRKGKKFQKVPGKRYLSDGNFLVEYPSIDWVLDALFRDAQAGTESFYEFCDNYGYSRDSIKAFDVYRACCDNGEKLRKALGSEYHSERERIESLGL